MTPTGKWCPAADLGQAYSGSTQKPKANCSRVEQKQEPFRFDTTRQYVSSEIGTEGEGVKERPGVMMYVRARLFG